jgi:hypothetical protein
MAREDTFGQCRIGKRPTTKILKKQDEYVFESLLTSSILNSADLVDIEHLIQINHE